MTSSRLHVFLNAKVSGNRHIIVLKVYTHFLALFGFESEASSSSLSFSEECWKLGIEAPDD
jgi:hypothetical protein